MNRVIHPFLIYLLLLATVPAMMVGCGWPPKAAPDPSSGPVAQEEDARVLEAGQGPVHLAVALSPSQPQLSDRPTLAVTVRSDEGVAVEKPAFGEMIGEFEVLDLQEAIEPIEGGGEQLQMTFTLEPPRRGTLEIDPITVYFKEAKAADGDQLQHVQTAMMRVPVGSVVEAQDPTLASLREAAPPVELPGSNLWLWLLTTIIVTVVAGGIMFALWRRRHVAEMAPPLTPEQWAQQALDRLLASGLAAMDVKVFYVELTGIVRHYIEMSFGVRAPEQTTEEFLREISDNRLFSSEESLSLKEFLESADLVKFAGYRPREDAIKRSVDRARAFIQLGLLRYETDQAADRLVEAAQSATT